MSKPFKCDIKVRSEAKRRQILEDFPAGDNLIKDNARQCKSRWDVARQPGETLFAWGGLTEQAPQTWRTYGHGI